MLFGSFDPDYDNSDPVEEEPAFPDKSFNTLSSAIAIPQHSQSESGTYMENESFVHSPDEYE